MKNLLFLSLGLFLNINIVASGGTLTIKSTSLNLQPSVSITMGDESSSTPSCESFQDMINEVIQPLCDEFAITTRIETADKQHLCGVLKTEYSKHPSVHYNLKNLYVLLLQYTPESPQKLECKNAEIIVNVYKSMPSSNEQKLANTKTIDLDKDVQSKFIVNNEASGRQYAIDISDKKAN